MRADAYLRREAGDVGDNLAQAITALELAQKWAVATDEPSIWSVMQTNLGQADLRNPNGDATQNRAKATARFEAVLAMPLGAGRLPQGWGEALAWLTKLGSVADDHRFFARSAWARDLGCGHLHHSCTPTMAAPETSSWTMRRSVAWYVRPNSNPATPPPGATIVTVVASSPSGCIATAISVSVLIDRWSAPGGRLPGVFLRARQHLWARDQSTVFNLNLSAIP